nr:4'-phosphopantetheinyl transferase superfamily protein [Streptomyces sp. EN23]
MTFKAEYIWIDGTEPTAKLRSKTKIMDGAPSGDVADLPIWGFDGSSRSSSTPVGPLRRGRRGEPLWPAGFTGSITHSGAYRAAVAAPARPGHVLGIDAERAVPLRPAVAAAIAYGEEPAHLAALPPVAGLPWETLLFSVKEAVYKAWNPLTAAPLGFGSARVAFRPRTRPGPGRAGSTGTLTAVPVGGPALPVLTGRYRAACGLLVCVVHSWPSA